MAYRVVLRPSADRELGRLPASAQRRVVRILSLLSAEPRPPGAKLLSGRDRIWRVRVGDYRILYQVEDEAALIRVVIIRHRSQAYR